MKVMTYNMHSGRGWRRSPRHWANPRKVTEIANVIASYAPDVCTLQEVDVGQASQIAEQLAMEVRSIASITGGDRRDYGIATLSKLPIADARELAMPERDRTRSALLTRHVWAGGELAVINVHLSMVFRIRMEQVAALASALPTGPCIIAGDFNAIALSPTYRKLAHGFRAATRFARTWPAPLAIWPIDHILIRAPLRPRFAGTYTNAGARRASDHLPVIAELEPLAP